MSVWSRIAHVFRPGPLNREIDEELQSHLEEAAEKGRDPEELRRAFGSVLRHREHSRDVRVAAWLDALRADVIFAWRQLTKQKGTSAAGIVSLALAVGACTAAFRLIDATLWRPLPVKDSGNLFVLTYPIRDFKGKLDQGDSFEYPLFRHLRQHVSGDAELLSLSYANRSDVTYGSDHDMEKATQQYVSGNMFASFGLQPALGRVLNASDDVKPGAHPVAVLSSEYWQRRFGNDPGVLGRTLRLNNRVYQIVGVVRDPFTGTEPGRMTDLFVPTMMNVEAIDESDWAWFRTWVHIAPGTPAGRVQQQLQAAFRAYRLERVKTWRAGVASNVIDEYVQASLKLEPASTGYSGFQREYRRSLLLLGALVVLVLLIACVNLTNLLTAQAAARAREMSLRVAIGAGRWRLMQLVLVQSALIALAAAVLGALFAAWSAPLVLGMVNHPMDPVRLSLPLDLRLLAFASGLTLLVTLLFGLAPAWRTSAVMPMAVVKGGADLSRHRLLHGLVGVQIAFCVLVLFLAGLFVSTFERLSHQPLGFVADRLLLLDALSATERETAYWEQVAQQLRAVPGVAAASVAGWPLMSGNAWVLEAWVRGRQPEPGTSPYLLAVSPGWLGTMRLPLLGGRDFTEADLHPGAAIVNEAFAKRYFGGQSPVGQTFELMVRNQRTPVRIVGYAADARYADMRESIRPTAYVPFRSTGQAGLPAKKSWATFVVRTAQEASAGMPALLRQTVPQARSEFRVSNINTQTALVQQHMLRERLLAVLSVFFAVVALLLAGVGLYGVLTHAMLQRRKEIGIRLALGAQAYDVAQRVVAQAGWMLLVGAAAGLAAGILMESAIKALLYEVHATDSSVLAMPALALLIVAVLAALIPVLRAIRIDPAVTLRGD